ncbi:MAG: hypothetical protein A4E28_01774 [Methanocella sp. PtaU1.Bin125]|nr:MAG: hypothetical protein A4E28_01774 [Methanocella sp. PtaU1.Bin125]
MRRALLSLLLIMTILLAVTIAQAQDFYAAGDITPANGWVTTGTWENSASPTWSGSWTETAATASHDLTTAASGVFELNVGFRTGEAANTVKIALKNGAGKEYPVEYKNGYFWFNGAKLGVADAGATARYVVKITSDDGKLWHVQTYGGSVDVNAGSAPTKVVVALTKADPAPAKLAPIIYWVDFISSGSNPTPTPTPTPAPSATPTPTPGPSATPIPSPTPVPVSGPISYDPAVVQDFYDNAYTKIYSPYDIITYNPDGTYTVTPGYAKADGSVTPIQATYSVSGVVTAAADGKPIEGASVVLGSAFRKTDDFGQFRFDGTAKGSADLAVSADGYASKTQAVDVNDNLRLSIALDPVSAGGSAVVSAANETGNQTPATNATTNTTAPVATPVITPANNTTPPVATQTKSPGFEALVAALSIIAVAGLLLYAKRKK